MFRNVIITALLAVLPRIAVAQSPYQPTIVHDDIAPNAARLRDFLLSETGQQLVEESGYVGRGNR